ncbi:MAG: tRNA uridine-5-carboxymethylaminomethyl(34) synthesis GTPase MnmE, partial [Paludibacteraceae bacterium]|nr:tRNA uridine-5-carboxymethylaminomethyl(34) synthesis GTPase MnmE [Paludibacteraceae bacterium]
MEPQPTICAVSTAPGIGGIAVIRVSGSDAIAICDRILRFRSKNLAAQPSHTAHLCQVYDDEKLLDEVVCTVFRGPNSFTGEDTVEIACHGSQYIQQELLRVLLKNGCTMASAGEFTKRAFLNGKMDLAEAEAVADLIASESAAAHRLALTQMRGGFSSELASLRTRLLELTSLLELELDFSEEDVEFADRSQLNELCQTISSRIHTLSQSFKLGNALKNGIPVAIVGETNAGKSTLLNRLLGEEKAIVSDIHGTTRDTIEDHVVIGGVNFRFIDTAGIRETDDQIENIGIKRSYGAMEKASVVVWMIDALQVSEHIDWMADRIVPRCEGKHLLIVFNKAESLSDEDKAVLNNLFANFTAPLIFLSAKFDESLAPLTDELLRVSGVAELQQNELLVTNMRHYEALLQAGAAIQRVQQ